MGVLNGRQNRKIFFYKYLNIIYILLKYEYIHIFVSASFPVGSGTKKLEKPGPTSSGSWPADLINSRAKIRPVL